jgi:GH15 family glucan-1,4-alpha-glucosidase
MGDLDTRVSDLGGYHLLWTRDMVSGATALLASGNGPSTGVFAR